MILGLSPGLQGLLVLGLVTFLLLVFQVLVGQRIIKFKGRTHMKVHRTGAWVLLALAAVHGILAVTIYAG